MLAIVSSAALQGIHAVPVLVEVNSGESGDPRLILVGLPDAAVKESDDRVFSALANSGYRKPQTRTTINLAPGDLRKEGPMYDLPIALGILQATGQLSGERRLDAFLIAGELSLSGATRPIRGGLAFAMQARSAGKRGVLLPMASAREASLVDEIEVYGVESLAQAAGFIEGKTDLPNLAGTNAFENAKETSDDGLDFSDVKGQTAVKRAVEIAVSGRHNLLMIGPPGSGKSMIAKRIPGIMPEPSLDEFLEILQIESAAGSTRRERIQRRRPYRAPHHTISDVGLLGGGSIPGPGEISLAHNGVLFMDELPEFKRSALEVMRQPLEDANVTISRSAGKVTLPCNFMLVSAMNPCPCGYLGSQQKECSCSPHQIHRYRQRVSGPLLDRIDIHIEAPALTISQLRDASAGESSASIRQRVEAARARQRKRFAGTTIRSNADMSHRSIRQHCQISPDLGDLLQQAMERLGLSARAYDRILKVSRTIADLAESETIQSSHLLEAIQYRSLDRLGSA
ncbi:YifB family Mg chelatase-like AAA ATPase [Pelagicoccus sp. SDUM812003]|uniref:YifB family Mg chelatase-like AAA ATPase n=1 Tax=Pelagicoccus sp. SDUM812003 TaxID=3041267 RepID=UPI00280D4657|nr:YifB family Mg chelatase-like AAA ATPase [Pelagicoccus sp. SDUM812003]MDQ8204751.1 YifB family Mg chelatase-like AAA ATPase [Pelagicoccus sp. SDUM812003]